MNVPSRFPPLLCRPLPSFRQHRWPLQRRRKSNLILVLSFVALFILIQLFQTLLKLNNYNTATKPKTISRFLDKQKKQYKTHLSQTETISHKLLRDPVSLTSTCTSFWRPRGI
ncbi:hypothetical protein GALMADRAFT_779309 [Galerina marginata CBS 339.88]|uniref:Uncharacterized protein n=1 Tax=Galerina marginata (strain CBS 339.88) TaxID=685588 RepID=A0A067SLE7_GALM3|nr:hypothetical protein GALMADRAFT_779309 [Galerina marginata CBS 339.88]